MPEITLTRRIGAPPEVVFDTITDHRRYPEYTPIRRVEIEREGEEEPNGKGAIRALHVVGPPIREHVIAFERPGLFTYEVLSGVPVREQIGTVTLDPEDGGTLMTYRIEITPSIPLSGPALAAGTRVAIGRLMAAVQREAESRAAAAAPAPSG